MNYKDTELFHENLTAVYDKFGREPMSITIPDVAKWLGIDQRTLRAMRDFPVKQIGTRAVVLKTALASWMSRQA